MTATDTKAQILSAAIDLFAQNGYERTTMRTIAKRVGVQSASIYYFFDSKESLLRTIFKEFELNFAKHRNKPNDIIKSAKYKPLSEVLSMLFYTFGNSEEHYRMMTISRVILSLQYENIGAQNLLEKVMIHDALDYGVCVLKGLHSLGVIREIDFQWTAFVFHSFAFAVLQENLRNLMSYADSSKKFEAGVNFLCMEFAKAIKA